ncbi:MAG: hypothetical protein IPP82_12725 [Xanthomonadales bacterium]|nr:hypothetical protein [Xanthomonadales bacterium]
MRAVVMLLFALACSSSLAQERETLTFKKTRMTVPSCGRQLLESQSAGAITLLPNQVACFALKVTDARIQLIEPPKGAAPESLLVLKLWYEPKTEKSFLSIHNPLSLFLTYKAHIRRTGAKSLEYTTTCPVLSHRDGLEFWTYEMSEIVISNLALVPESKTIECH